MYASLLTLNLVADCAATNQLVPPTMYISEPHLFTTGHVHSKRRHIQGGAKLSAVQTDKIRLNKTHFNLQKLL